MIDKLVDGPPHGAFGWTLPDGQRDIEHRELVPWLASMGVAWLKYPCWIAPDDNATAEKTAILFSKLQESEIQTVGMLDEPPPELLADFNLRGRKKVVAAQLFRDIEVWKPLLEPVMTRLTFKVRTWQIGRDRDFSFLGRPRLQEMVREISTGLQGYGQPIDVAISWPWLEPQLGAGESSWQAICRSASPPLRANELNSFLSLNQSEVAGDGPRTWLLLDPISSKRFDRDSRVQDLILRMATIRSHRVQAAFVGNPFDPEFGLLRADGRPDDLLLPWRTTSRLIGNLRNVGSLQMRSGAQNSVFANSDRAVLLVWSPEKTEELMYLGENVKTVDAYGRVSDLPTDTHLGLKVHRISIGPIPQFIVGADPTLLAFRMSVNISRNHLDTLLGQQQHLAVSFTNPTREGLGGAIRVRPPKNWSVDSELQNWETLGGRSRTIHYNIMLDAGATIGRYEVPIQIEIQSSPPQRITVSRWVEVGPKDLDIKVDTRLDRAGRLIVKIELTNSADRPQSYDCLLFPPGSRRQYQRQFVTIPPEKTVVQNFIWQNGRELVGRPMTLSAQEQSGGGRVANYVIDVTP